MACYKQGNGPLDFHFRKDTLEGVAFGSGGPRKLPILCFMKTTWLVCSPFVPFSLILLSITD